MGNINHQARPLTRLGVDIGGTFTDVAVVGADGQLEIGKVLTTPGREEEGVLAAVTESGVDLSRVDRLVHGTTLAINALLERKGAEVALVTTRGFRDVHELGRGNRPQSFNAFYRRDPVLVPRQRRFEIGERTLASGEIALEPTDEELAELVNQVRTAGVGAIAVAFLNAYVNPANELKVANHLRRIFPECFVTASAEISRQWREFERFTTAAANAYVGPALDRYLENIETHLAAAGFKGEFNLFDSNGGAIHLDSARRFPVRLLESGPVGGVLCARNLARELGYKNVVTFDMGGTTAKMSLIADGAYASTNLYWLGGYETGFPIQIPSVDIVEVGAGGGSIAWADDDGRLRVGPRSAGASPGPACYRAGGEDPTVTDANLFCGRLSPAHFISSIAIDKGLATQAIERLADRLQMDPLRLALGILALADMTMADAVRTKTVSLGLDPRDFVMIAFGGAGPMHACRVAAEVGIGRVLVPPSPGHFSAIGMLQANLRFDRQEVFTQVLDNLDLSLLEQTLSRIGKELTGIIGQSRGAAPESLEFSYGLALRYEGQEHSLLIHAPVKGLKVTPDVANGFRQLFDEEYRVRFGHQHKKARVEVVEIEVVAEQQSSGPIIARLPQEAAGTRGTIEAYFSQEEGPITVTVVPRHRLSEGESLEGPLLIYEDGSNTVIPPGATGTVLKGGYLMLDVSGVAAALRRQEEKEDLDILDLELFRHSATALLDELEANLTRTAYSPLVYEYKDYTVGILNAEFELMNQSRMSLPLFIADLGKPVQDAVEIIGVENLSPGDIFVTNYAAIQGQHLNNVVVATPIYSDQGLIAYIAIRAHWADVGGMAPGSVTWEAREIYQEGVQFRGLRVMKAGKLVPEVVATILANTRMEEWVYGDLMAQLGVCILGCQRWQERIAARWQAPAIMALWRLQNQQSAELARRRIRNLPDGTYRAACRMDDSGVPGSDPMTLKVKVIIEGDRMVIDFREMPPQSVAPINSGRNGGAFNLARVSYKMLVAPDYPADQGLFEPLEIDLVDGTVVTARNGAPMCNWNATLATVVDLVLRAIGESRPELVPAGHHGTIAYFSFSQQGQDGRWLQYPETAIGGWGGSARADGFSPLKTIAHGDNRDVPIEITEARFPLRVLKYAFIPNSAGRGKHRGGFGVEKIFEVTQDVLFGAGIERILDPPWGLAGGEAGQPGSIEIRGPSAGPWREVRKASQILLPKGSHMRIRTAGGGGWGPANRRPQELINKDIIAGLVIDN